MNDGLPLLVGLNGFKGAGKDTVGKIMVDNWEFKRIAFADKLKEAAAALFDINISLWDSLKNDPDQVASLYDREVGDLYSTLTVRELLKRFGTEMGREVFGEDFWIDQVLPLKEFSTANADKRYHGNRVVTDARFENELYRIHELLGYNIRIVRPGLETDGHASEVEPAEFLIDYVIENDGTIEDLIPKVADALTHFYQVDRSSTK